MDDLEQLAAQIRNADVFRTEKDFFDWVVKAEFELVSHDTFPPVLWQALLNVFRTDVPDHSGYWQLLHFIQNNDVMLSSDQREQIKFLLVQIFPRFKDWMSAFVAAEMLGAYYANDEEGLQVLNNLAQKSQGSVLACLPHAIETVFRETSSDEIRAKALKELKNLSTHSSELVRQEATISLAKVNGR
jgi:hypothetical protein